VLVDHALIQIEKRKRRRTKRNADQL